MLFLPATCNTEDSKVLNLNWYLLSMSHLERFEYFFLIQEDLRSLVYVYSETLFLVLVHPVFTDTDPDKEFHNLLT